MTELPKTGNRRVDLAMQLIFDSTTQALLRFRQGNFIQLESDYIDEPTYIEQREFY